MIPIRLKLSGFLSYWEESDLDFTPVDLACISGSNGAGKSSLLDAITWALFGEARRRDDAIINSHCETAEVTLDFDYEGHRYRILRSKSRGKSARLDLFILDDQANWKPLTEATMSRTQDRIIDILRLDYETFINASFFLQGKADQFAQQTPGNRKKILSTILGLERWETYRNTASRMIREIEQEKSAQTGTLQEIEAELGEEAERKANLAQVTDHLSKAEALRFSREETLSLAKRQADSLDGLRKNVDMLKGLLEKSRETQTQLEEYLAEREKERGGYQQILDDKEKIETGYQSWLDARKELERWDGIESGFHKLNAEYAKHKMVVETERTRLLEEQRSLHDEKKKALESEGKIPGLKEALRTYETEMKLLETRLDEKSKLETGIRDLSERQGTLSAQNKQLRIEMKELSERIENLKEATGATCPLCGQSLTNEDRLRLIASLEKEGKEKGDLFRKNESEQEDIEKRHRGFEDALKEITRAEKDHSALKIKYAQDESLLKQHQDILTLWKSGKEARLAEIQAQLEKGDFAPEAQKALAGIEKELKKLGYDPEAQVKAVNQELSLRKFEEEKNKLEKAVAALEPLMRDIESKRKHLTDTLEDIKNQQAQFSEADEKYQKEAAQLPDLPTLEQELTQAREEENRLRLEVGAAQQKVAVLVTLRERAINLRETIAAITTRIAHLRILEHAFSREGIPAWLIEEALPQIQDRANELLDRLSGGAMSIRFETQGEYKDKNREDKKETLDILISDTAGIRPYEMFSGGEAFRVNFAIRLALSHVLAQRAGARLQTLVIDEGFGSQDTEGRQRLIEAINQVRPDFARILVITHLEELKDAFPARIEVEKTARGSKVRVMA